MKKTATPPANNENSELLEAELKFVKEYMVDRDPRGAALRAGVARINLKRTVEKWLSDSRIVRAIQDATDNADLDKMISPQRIMAGFIEVAFSPFAPPAARNTALKELAAMKKMYGEDDNDRSRSGVLFVPGTPALVDWDTAAQAMQAKLKQEVKH